MIDKDGHEWGERGDPISQAVLFTNRSVMVFNDRGHQIPFYQKALTSRRINKKLAREVAERAGQFFIARHGAWCQPIEREEFEWILGLPEAP